MEGKKNRVVSLFLYVVLFFYLLFMLKLLLLSRISFEMLFDESRVIQRSVNLVPLRSIQTFLFSKDAQVMRFAFSNVMGNVIAFVPMGAFFVLLGKDKRVGRNVLRVLLVSLCVEVLQGVLGIGAADIDDVILNTLGGLIGICGYRLLMRVTRSQERARVIVAIVSLIALPYVLYLLLFIQLRL